MILLLQMQAKLPQSLLTTAVACEMPSCHPCVLATGSCRHELFGSCLAHIADVFLDACSEPAGRSKRYLGEAGKVGEAPKSTSFLSCPDVKKVVVGLALELCAEKASGLGLRGSAEGLCVHALSGH